MTFKFEQLVYGLSSDYKPHTVYMTILSFVSSTSVGAPSLDVFSDLVSQLELFYLHGFSQIDIVGFMPNRY